MPVGSWCEQRRGAASARCPCCARAAEPRQRFCWIPAAVAAREPAAAAAAAAAGAAAVSAAAAAAAAAGAAGAGASSSGAPDAATPRRPRQCSAPFGSLGRALPCAAGAGAACKHAALGARNGVRSTRSKWWRCCRLPVAGPACKQSWCRAGGAACVRRPGSATRTPRRAAPGAQRLRLPAVAVRSGRSDHAPRRAQAPQRALEQQPMMQQRQAAAAAQAQFAAWAVTQPPAAPRGAGGAAPASPVAPPLTPAQQQQQQQAVPLAAYLAARQARRACRACYRCMTWRRHPCTGARVRAERIAAALRLTAGRQARLSPSECAACA
jgi:hypothetical protein